MADRGPCKNVFSHDFLYNDKDDVEKAEESEKEDEEESRTEFVPLISYISPSLARLVSPLSVMTRQEVTTAEQQGANFHAGGFNWQSTETFDAQDFHRVDSKVCSKEKGRTRQWRKSHLTEVCSSFFPKIVKIPLICRFVYFLCC